jgi:hypothetical protein
MIFFLVQSKGKFLSQFANENLKKQADAVWQSLESVTPFLVAIFIVAGIGSAILYYTWFNNISGRHYKVKYWGLFAGIFFSLTLLLTLIAEYGLIKTNLNDGISPLYWKCAISNALYCFGSYLVVSFLWCNWGRTNAYRFLKIKFR